MFRSFQIITRELSSLLNLYYSIHNSIGICKGGVVGSYRVVQECVVEQRLGVHLMLSNERLFLIYLKYVAILLFCDQYFVLVKYLRVQGLPTVHTCTLRHVFNSCSVFSVVSCSCLFCRMCMAQKECNCCYMQTWRMRLLHFCNFACQSARNSCSNSIDFRSKHIQFYADSVSPA